MGFDGEKILFLIPTFALEKKKNFSIIISKTKIMTTLRWKHIFIVHKKKFKVFLFTDLHNVYIIINKTEAKVAYLPTLILFATCLIMSVKHYLWMFFQNFCNTGTGQMKITLWTWGQKIWAVCFPVVRPRNSKNFWIEWENNFSSIERSLCVKLLGAIKIDWSANIFIVNKKN